MPFGRQAQSIAQPSPIYESAASDDGPQPQGGLLAMDLSKTEGGSTSRGITISGGMAVSKFVAGPTWHNAPYLVGVADAAFNSGTYHDFFWAGPARVLVKNETGQTIQLAVGDLLAVSPTNSHAVPLYQPLSDGSALAVSNHAPRPIGFAREAVEIEAGLTAFVHAWLWPPRPPAIETLYRFFDATPQTFDGALLAVTRGPGRIVRAGLGCQSSGTQGTLELDVAVDGASIFAATPLLDHDAAEPFHSLAHFAAPGASSGPGTSGRYGGIDAAYFGPGSLITLGMTAAGGYDGAGLQVQVELAYF